MVVATETFVIATEQSSSVVLILLYMMRPGTIATIEMCIVLPKPLPIVVLVSSDLTPKEPTVAFGTIGQVLGHASTLVPIYSTILTENIMHTIGMAREEPKHILSIVQLSSDVTIKEIVSTIETKRGPAEKAANIV